MKNKKKVRKVNKISILVVLVLFLVITILIIYAKNMQPTSEATEATISVTYKVGDGTYTNSEGNLVESVTYDEIIYDSQTQGDNDYTDNKIVLKTNSEIGFTHENTTYNDLEYEMVLTGWKLISVTQDGTTITTYVEPENQNYADPSDATKDIDTVYAQSGWYIVPEGVTSITVEAVYGRAIYIRSPYDTMYYDEYHIFYYGENDDGTTSLDGSASPYSSDLNYGTSEDDAVATLKRAYELIDEDSNATVYDNVIVLCEDLWEINYCPDGDDYIPSEYTENYEVYSSDSLGYNTSSKKPATVCSKSAITGDTSDQYTLICLPPENNIYCRSSFRFDNLTLGALTNSNLKDIHETDATVNTYSKNSNYHSNNSGSTFEVTETVSSTSSRSFFQESGMKAKINGGSWKVYRSWSNSTTTLSGNTYIQIGGLAEIGEVSNVANSGSGTSETYETNPPTLVITGANTGDVYGTSMTSRGKRKRGCIHIHF